MTIVYTYKISAVDENARCMEVIYSSEGYQTMHIGARLPFEGEQLEDVIRAYAPVPLWEEMSKAVVVPEVGLSGTILPPPVVLPEQVMSDSGQVLPTVSSGEIPQTVL